MSIRRIDLKPGKFYLSLSILTNLLLFVFSPAFAQTENPAYLELGAIAMVVLSYVLAEEGL